MRKILVGLLSTGLLGMALAATPANTNISNQASANYIDSLNQPRSILSNEVITVVQQVYSFTITPNGTTESSPGQTRIALPGAQIYFAYTVTNTGNGTDTINLSSVQGTSDNFDLSGIIFYRDTNCDGNLDSGELATTSLTLDGYDAAAAGSPPPHLGCVIVEATIPSSATNTQYGNLNLVGNGGGSTTDNDNWARATATTQAALDITKAAAPIGAVAAGSNITYTIDGQNRGGNAANGVTVSGLAGAGILVSDPIPAGLVVSALPTGSAGAGTVQMVKTLNGGTSWSALVAADLPLTGLAAATVRVGMYISGTGAFFPVNASYTFSFVAGVPTTATVGTSYVNTATVQFNNGSNQSINSNSTTNTVSANYSVQVGPNGAPTATGPADQQAQGPVYSGQTVSFTNTLRNTGNDSDSFTLAVSGAPGSWSCGVYNGATPISGPVGPFGAGVDFSFQVQCQIPASYTNASAVNLTVTATSINNPGQSDTTLDIVSSVLSGIGVDLAAHGNTSAPATPANDNPTGQNANPGTSVEFALDVRNNGQSADSFNLTSTQPATWGTTFYPDADCNGAMDTPVPAPVSNTGLMNAATVSCFIATVTVPTGVAPGSNPITFTATSTTLASSTDTVNTTVTVNQLNTFDLDPPRSGTTTTPGTIVYTHTMTNAGNAGATVDVPALTSAYGWTYNVSLDGTTWSSSLSGVSIAANSSQALYVQVLVPGGQPINRFEIMPIVANATYPGSIVVSDTVNDRTDIVAGDLELTKSATSYVGNAETTVRSATGAQAYPGDRIVYTVFARNLGTANLKQLIIQDPLPGFTTFVSVSATTSGFTGGTVLYSTNGSTWSATAPTSLATGQRIYVGVDTDADTNITAADLMAPGATVTITFKVFVQ
jgi:uncharacterized repeat protein (TIGR01451 family)